MIESGLDTHKGTNAVAMVGRHPICDARQHTIGYELLFRNVAGENTASIMDDDRATAQVIVNSFLDIGMDELIRSNLAFINVTRGFIMSDCCRVLPKDRCVFEILEDVTPDADLLRALGKLQHEGFRFALDDYAFEPSRTPLLPYCSYVKVDLRQANREILEANSDR